MLGAIGAYDVISLLAEAFNQTDGGVAAINQHLHSIQNFQGKIGQYGALPDNSFDVPASLGEIRNGQVVKF